MHAALLTLVAAAFTATALLPGSSPERPIQGPSLEFGFSDFEIYELGSGISSLRGGDLNGDGLGDLVVANNSRSRIDVLRRLPEGSPDADPTEVDEDDPNPVAYDGRFQVEPIPLERRVLQLGVGDFDRDGLDDVVCATSGGWLELYRSTPAEGEPRSLRRRLDELAEGCDLLEVVDLDADGEDDLLLAGGGQLLLLEPSPAGGFGEVRLLDRIEADVDRVLPADLNGDGQLDLLYARFERDWPFQLRLRRSDGTFGPRIDVDLPQVRSAWASDLDGDGAAEILAVFKLSGRVAAFGLAAREEGSRGLARYSLGPAVARGRGEARSIAVGDLDGDGCDDAVVAEPGMARVVLWRGQRGRLTFERRSFPSLVGVRDPRVGDVDGDGAAELAVCSAPERMIGLCRLDEAGRLPFPETRPVDGEPTALDLSDLNADGFDDLVACVSKGEGRQREISLQIWYGSPEGPAAEPTVHALSSLDKAPDALRIGDLTRDGVPDAIAFLPGERDAPAILVQREGSFVTDERGEDAPGLGILVGARPASLSFGDADGDGLGELLVASGNFARSLYFEAAADGALTPRVLEQWNGPAPDSRISGATCADLDGDGKVEVVLRDERSKELLVFRAEDGGGGAPHQRVEAGRLAFAGMEPADLNGDGAVDLALFGADQLAVLFSGSREPTLMELASYEPPRQNLHFDRITAGDLNGDGSRDVVVTETAKHSVLILSTRERGLDHALGFPVFEEPSFFGTESRGREPREILCTDITGDHRPELAVIVHEKLIVYVQG